MRIHRLARLMSCVICVALLSGMAVADVTIESETKTEFKGTLGTMMKLFGGGKPSTDIVYYSGNLRRSDHLDKKGKVRTSEIIDLDQELFITLNHKKKRYTQQSFAEWRQQMEEAMTKTQTMQAEQEETGPDEDSLPQFTVDFNVEPTGKVEQINGRQAREVVVTISVKPADTAQTAEEGEETPGGEFNIKSINWIADDVQGNDEIRQFAVKLAEKMGIMPDKQKMADMWNQVMMSYPQIGDAVERLDEETEALEGTVVRTHTVFESVPPPRGEDDEEDEEEESKSVKGLLGGFGKKMMKKDKPEGPQVLLELHSDIKRQDITPVDPALFVIPEKYKESK